VIKSSEVASNHSEKNLKNSVYSLYPFKRLNHEETILVELWPEIQFINSSDWMSSKRLANFFPSAALMGEK